MRPTTRPLGCCALLIALAMSGVAHAQAGGGAAAMPISAAPTIQPATSAASQVRQPPQNSAMRRAGTGGVAGGTSANPMGMAGMNAGGGATNALTLSGGTGGGGAGGGQGAAGGMGATEAGQSGQHQQPTRITDTGVTQRTPANGNGNGQR